MATIVSSRPEAVVRKERSAFAYLGAAVTMLFATAAMLLGVWAGQQPSPPVTQQDRDQGSTSETSRYASPLSGQSLRQVADSGIIEVSYRD